MESTHPRILPSCNPPRPNGVADRTDQPSSDRKEVVMKFALKSAALCAALVVGSLAHAASYDYTENYNYVGRPALPDAEARAKLQSDTETCDNIIGGQNAGPSAAYR